MPRLGETAQNEDLATGNVVFPVGTVFIFLGAVAPAGWMLCQGGTVQRTTPLGAKLAGKYGPGDGVNTYNVPDWRDRFVLGKRSGINIGETGGALNHTHGTSAVRVPSHTHGVGSWQMPAHGHGHSFYLPDHAHANSVEAAHVGTPDSGNFVVGVIPNANTSGILQQNGGIGGGITGAAAVALTGNTDAANPLIEGAPAGAEAPWQAVNFIVKL